MPVTPIVVRRLEIDSNPSDTIGSGGGGGGEQCQLFASDQFPDWTTSVWGYLNRAVDETWAAKRAGATANFYGYGNVFGEFLSTTLISDTVAGQWTDLVRNIVLVDLSDIPAGSTITSARLRLHVGNSLYIDQLSQEFGVVALAVGSPVSDTSVTDTDYAIANYQSSILLSELVSMSDVRAYALAHAGSFLTHSEILPWDVEFNAAGIAYIQSIVNGDQIARLGVLLESDRTNAEPAWASGQTSGIDWIGAPQYISDDGLESPGPQVEVCWSGPAATPGPGLDSNPSDTITLDPDE